MTVTEPTTKVPEVPEWLNLDVLVSPECRVELAKLAIEGEALIPQLSDFAIRADAALTKAESRDLGITDADYPEFEIHDGMSALVYRACGGQRLRDVIQTLMNVAGYGINEHISGEGWHPGKDETAGTEEVSQ